MRVFRLTRKKYAASLSGIGSAKYNHRWNSKGTEVIYCADSRALAMAEILVNVGLALLPDDFVMVEIDIPDTVAMLELKSRDLPRNWDNFPHNRSTREIGDKFSRDNSHCVLKVPSAVVKGDSNYLLNPMHREFRKIKISAIEDFSFDKRLFSS